MAGVKDVGVATASEVAASTDVVAVDSGEVVSADVGEVVSADGGGLVPAVRKGDMKKPRSRARKQEASQASVELGELVGEGDRATGARDEGKAPQTGDVKKSVRRVGSTVRKKLDASDEKGQPAVDLSPKPHNPIFKSCTLNSKPKTRNSKP